MCEYYFIRKGKNKGEYELVVFAKSNNEIEFHNYVFWNIINKEEYFFESNTKEIITQLEYEKLIKEKEEQCLVYQEKGEIFDYVDGIDCGFYREVVNTEVNYYMDRYQIKTMVDCYV